MATVISIYNDDTGAHIKTFMVQPKPKRRLFYPEAVILSLILLDILVMWL